jgi:hypothetical protein
MMQLSGVNAAGSVVLATIAATLTWTTAARAEVAPAPEPATWPGSTTAVTEQTSYTPPNRAIVAGGIILFAGSYIPSVIVAAANSNSYDKHLYIPIVGPWLDLSKRPGCQLGDCATQSAFMGLLIVDGLAQTLGVLGTALGFVVPERHTRVVTANGGVIDGAPPDKPEVHIVPARVSDGYGVAAIGKF